MSDVVEAVHPVPLSYSPRRSHRRLWCLARTVTPVELTRVPAGDVAEAGEFRLHAKDDATVRVAVIEGRTFVEAERLGGDRKGLSLQEVLSGSGGWYRNLHAGSLLLAGTPASAIPPHVDAEMRPASGFYEDCRGEDVREALRGRIHEDLAEAARQALREFLARNVRLCGDRAYVDAGGPLVAPMPGSTVPYATFLGVHVSASPFLAASPSHVRLSPADVAAYACAVPFRGAGKAFPAPTGLPEPDGARSDLAFANAAPGALLAAAASRIRRGRKDPALVDPDALRDFEALVRPAHLGAVGLIGEHDLAELLPLVSRAADWIARLDPVPGTRSEIREAQIVEARMIRRDAEDWLIPRAAARAALAAREDMAHLDALAP